MRCSISGPRSSRQFCSSSGFTLVELLVVIGIISLLISILLPTLNKAMEAGNRIKCASNLRQIYTGAMFYAQDNKGRFPSAWADGGQLGALRALGTKGDVTRTWRYITNDNVWDCPSDLTRGSDFVKFDFADAAVPGGYMGRRWGDISAAFPFGSGMPNVSYVMNRTAGWYDNEKPGRWNFPAYRPSSRGGKCAYDALFFEGEAGTETNISLNAVFGLRVAYFKQAAGDYPSQMLYSALHRGSINICGGDGHVDLLMISKGEDLEASENSGKIPWHCTVFKPGSEYSFP